MRRVRFEPITFAVALLGAGWARALGFEDRVRIWNDLLGRHGIAADSDGSTISVAP